MAEDPSWDVMPMAHPALARRKRMRLVSRAVLRDPVGQSAPVRQDRGREQIVLPSALDRASRELLLRAQQAVRRCLDAEADELETEGRVPTSTLEWHEWEIAVALRDITDLRAEHDLNVAASAGPRTAAVLRSQQEALARAQEAIADRVAGLERYAASMTAAATAYRDWQDALRVADMNDRYLDLVARTAADEYAADEINDETERTLAQQAYRQASQDVSTAAAALVLPAS